MPALPAAAAAVLAVHYYFVEPAGQVRPIETSDILTLAIFSAAALLVSALTAKLARLMGGDITVRRQPGAGSAFFLWLPAAAPAEAALVASAAPERRGEARYAQGLGEVGSAALAEVERILHAYVARLRTDPQVPSAHILSEAELDDHIASFLADTAQCLAIIEDARGAPTDLMRQSNLLQRVVAERHGEQRQKLGWSEVEVRSSAGLDGRSRAT